MADENGSNADVRPVWADVGVVGEPWAGRAAIVEWAFMGVSSLSSRAGTAARLAGLLSCAGALALSGCAQPTPKYSKAHGSKEYFPTSIYGAASPRMVADGQPVPKGGGQYLVGHPYRIAGKTYYPTENPHYSAVGMASWYGDAFHGRRTANGEVYDMHSLTAAHPTLPLPCYARVTNTANGYSVIVRVNDRGPYHGGRVMDVSSRVADVLDFKGAGTARIKVEYVGAAPMEGSDDNQLLASLRTDGSPAHIDGYAEATMVADAAPAPPIFSLFSSPPQRAAAPPPPPPPPQVTQVAAAPPPPPAAAPEAAEDSQVAAVETPKPPKLIHPPMPPERPFDLGAAKRDPLMQLAAAPLPPHRLQSGDRALYFAASHSAPPAPFDKAMKRAKTKSLADAED